ncbi:MAG: hypothetical protein ACUVTD_04585 [Nitrososphaerales archaeon]
MTKGMPVEAESISPERHELRCVRLPIHTMRSGSLIIAQQLKGWCCMKQKLDARKMHAMNMHQNHKPSTLYLSQCEAFFRL